MRRLPLRSSAAVLRVPLRLRGANKFLVEVFAESGSRVEVTPGEFSIHRGLTAAAAPLSRSIGVVLRDEGGGGRKSVDWLVQKGTVLPVQVTYPCRTTLALEPGGEVEVVGIYLVEGEARRPDRNRVVGSIEITDSDVPRTVPAGSPVEITLEISASRIPTARVFLPLTDQTFDVKVQVAAEEPTAADLTMALLGERDRLDAAAAHLTPSEITSFNAEFVDVSRRVNSLSQTDHGASQQTLMSLKSLQERLDQADAKFDLPRACADGRQEYDLASEVAVPMGSESQVRRLDALGVELDQAIEGGDIADIERSTSKIVRLRFEVLAQQPWFWKEWFEQLSTSATAWRDETEAKRFMRDGATALSRDDVAGLRRATLGLSALAPGQQGSFSNVGLRRG